MEDKFIRYTKLYFIILLMFLAVPLIIALLVWTFWGFSKLISYGPAEFIFELLMITMPSAVFSSAYLIFFKRTKKHPVPAVRVFSMILFVIGIATCLFLLVTDIIYFFKKTGVDISNYKCFSLAFLAGNVGTLFFVAIVQAFTTNKEVDWIEKRKQRNTDEYSGS